MGFVWGVYLGLIIIPCLDGLEDNRLIDQGTSESTQSFETSQLMKKLGGHHQNQQKKGDSQHFAFEDTDYYIALFVFG